MIGTCDSIIEPNVEITQEEYESIISIIQSKPQDTEDTIYVLDAESMEYIPTERPIEPIEEPNNNYGIPDDIYNAIIDDYTDELFEMGVL